MEYGNRLILNCHEFELKNLEVSMTFFTESDYIPSGARLQFAFVIRNSELPWAFINYLFTFLFIFYLWFYYFKTHQGTLINYHIIIIIRYHILPRNSTQRQTNSPQSSTLNPQSSILTNWMNWNEHQTLITLQLYTFQSHLAFTHPLSTFFHLLPLLLLHLLLLLLLHPHPLPLLHLSSTS